MLQVILNFSLKQTKKDYYVGRFFKCANYTAFVCIMRVKHISCTDCTLFSYECGINTENSFHFHFRSCVDCLLLSYRQVEHFTFIMITAHISIYSSPERSCSSLFQCIYFCQESPEITSLLVCGIFHLFCVFILYYPLKVSPLI